MFGIFCPAFQLPNRPPGRRVSGIIVSSFRWQDLHDVVLSKTMRPSMMVFLLFIEVTMVKPSNYTVSLYLLKVLQATKFIQAYTCCSCTHVSVCWSLMRMSESKYRQVNIVNSFFCCREGGGGFYRERAFRTYKDSGEQKLCYTSDMLMCYENQIRNIIQRVTCV